MKNILCLAAIIVTLVGCQKDESRKVIQAQTPDGYAFHFMPIYEEGVTDITITIAWPMSWTYDGAKNPAVPHVAAEAILSGGTKERAPQDIMELFNDKNAQGRLYVRADHAIGELSFPKEHIDDIVGIASEMLANPQFDQAWVDRIKQGVLSNQMRAQSQTANKMWDVARLAILQDTPIYNFLTLPSPNIIENVGVADLREWHQNTLINDNIQIAVTGAISRKDAGNAIDRLLADLPKKAVHTASVNTSTNFHQKMILLHVPDAEKTTLGFIGQLPPTTQEGSLIDLLALNYFSRANGPLFEAIRTNLRASYGMQAGFTNYDRATRVMFIAGEIEMQKLSEAVTLITDTYGSYRNNPDLSGIDEVRNRTATGIKQNVMYVDVAARTILERALDGHDPSLTPHLGEHIEGILAKDIAERMRDVFPNSDELIIVAASPDKNALPNACVITAISQVSQCH